MYIVASQTTTFKPHRRAGKYLNTLISRIDHGKKIATRTGSHPIHTNRHTAIMEYYRGQRAWLPAIRHRDYRKHFDGSETFYFTADAYRTRTLINLDIDCHKSGSLAGAVQFAEWIKANIFPNLYYEKSTGGNGVHGYVRILTGNTSGPFSVNVATTPTQLCEWIKLLQYKLQQFQHRFDVEMIEIKGHPHVKHYKGRELVGITSGQHAKLPREIADRFEEFQNTTEIDIRSWVFPLVVEEKKEPERQPGSTQIDLGNYQELYPIARADMGGRKSIRVNENIAMDMKDYAIGLSIVRWASERMNGDGTMPGARIEALWNSAYASGQTDRQFNSSRWKAVRDLMTKNGHIDWEDNTYVPGNGETGRACKWTMSERSMALLEAVDDMSSRERENLIIGYLPLQCESITPKTIWAADWQYYEPDWVERVIYQPPERLAA
jgi:hypothetical protein